MRMSMTINPKAVMNMSVKQILKANQYSFKPKSFQRLIYNQERDATLAMPKLILPSILWTVETFRN